MNESEPVYVKNELCEQNEKQNQVKIINHEKK